MIKRKFVLFLTAVISILTIACLTGCSSIKIEGKRHGYPSLILLQETAFSSHIDIIEKRKEINKVFSAFDGAEFQLSDEGFLDSDGTFAREICVDIYFGNDSYSFNVAENGEAVCYFGENKYISDAGSVDYTALKNYIQKLKEKNN